MKILTTSGYNVPEQENRQSRTKQPARSRIDQRQLDFLARGLTGFGVVGQLLQDEPSARCARLQRPWPGTVRGKRGGNTANVVAKA